MITKQQQLEWLANNLEKWKSGYDYAVVEKASDGYLYIRWPSVCASGITKKEWRQERDKMQKKVEQVVQPTQDNSWYEREELPPVGYECEAIRNGEWVAVEVLRHRVNNVEMNVAAVMDCTSFNVFWSDDFRPLCTEREKAINEMNELVGNIERYPTWGDAMAALYDAGYRKVASK